DGSAPQTVAITAHANDGGRHTHVTEIPASDAASNPYTITVTVHHEGTDSNVVTSTATIGEVAVVATGGQTLVGSEGALVSGTVEIGSASGRDGAEGDVEAAIGWGDGCVM